ncbi:MAG: hypothetical protein ABI175_04320 [Polyangiales bacterium]
MKLRLADGIRAPRPDEYPAGTDVAKIDALRAAARIIPGYRLRSETNDRFFAEVNVDADRLWEAFEALAFVLPEPVSGIVGFKDDDPMFSEYADKAPVLAALYSFRDELCHDGFLAFGAIHQTATQNEEVFVTSTKYLRVWGADLAAFRETMTRLELAEVPDLAFVDELPVVSESLRVIRGETARHHEQVIAEVRSRFDALTPWTEAIAKKGPALH